jgi:N-acetylmuramoyl-L-alanine amidase
MKRFAFAEEKSKMKFWAALATLALIFSAPSAKADDRTSARDQYQSAVRMRTNLEGQLEKNRSVEDYKKTVNAYHKVYFITPSTEDAAPALVAEGELYQEMGRLYDPKYFQTAVQRFNFLLKQYPGSRYRFEALFSIGKIQEDDLKSAEDAQASFTQYLKQYPHSSHAKDAQRELKLLASQPGAQPQPEASPAGLANVSNAEPPLNGKSVEPKVSSRGSSAVTEVRTWNGTDSTRIIISLNDTVKYDAQRIPDRIYFDIYKATLGRHLEGKKLDLQNSVVKTVRVAQNKPDVVRVVLDVGAVKSYTAFLLANPYRLVIDIHDRGAVNLPPLASDTTDQEKPNTSASDASKSGTPALLAENLPDSRPLDKVYVMRSPMQPPSIKTPETAPALPGKVAVPVLPKPTLKVDAKASKPAPTAKIVASAEPPPEPKPTRDGQRSLSRMLGLKISRIVIDAGHGGHDTGTVGPHGLMEKDLCLDVALRLGALIEQKLPSAEVVYTRKDDTFIPLEERTAIANREKADLFISIHANSSHDDSARGIETYYLNFANSSESMEVASRENALAQESMHDLQDLIQKIARNEKIEESKEFASDVQDSLTQRLQLISRSEKNRGVKRAPFVVLIGADMPSILSEISFVSNPNDERLLRKPDQRQRIADGLYRGISSYLESINSLTVNQKLVSEKADEPSLTIASNGNPK